MSDKTEEPTPRRLNKARQEGDSAVSATLGQSVGFVVVVALLPGLFLALTLGAGGTAYVADGVSDNTWTTGNSGGFVLFANIPIAAQTSLTSTSSFTGPATLPLEAGKLTITTIR